VQRHHVTDEVTPKQDTILPMAAVVRVESKLDTYAEASTRSTSVISTSSEWTAHRDTTQLYTTGTNTFSAPGAGIGLLGVGGVRGSSMDLGETVIFSDKLSSGDRTKMLAYLKSKWATP
jgi:hypothetical protein